MLANHGCPTAGVGAPAVDNLRCHPPIDTNTDEQLVINVGKLNDELVETAADLALISRDTLTSKIQGWPSTR